MEYRLADDGIAEKARQMALAVWRSLGCRDAGQVGLRVDGSGRVHALKVGVGTGLSLPYYPGQTSVKLATSFERKRVFEMKGERDIERKICGTIFPVEWDENNNVARVVIDTPDQDGYLIELDKKGKELLDFIRLEVEVSGTMREDEGGNLIFKVKEYSLIKG